MELTPFHIEVPQADLDDLRDRLRRTRWAERETVADGDALDWSQGAPLAYMEDLCTYWAQQYDWRAVEARVNALPQYRAVIDGLGLHVLHVRSPEPDALPLIMTHGWPGSIVEFLDVIGPLSDPRSHGGDAADAFHVVCPSLPGYGWSDKPAATGWDVVRIAAAWDELMRGLGYDRYAAQGGDWGSMVSMTMAMRHPASLVGIHVNMPIVRPDRSTFDDLTDAERSTLDDMARHRRWGVGYSTQQSTRPQTLGYALADSPVGQCAWVVEKFHEWSEPGATFAKDRLLDNVMFYWLPSAGASSARLYWESFREVPHDTVSVPTGCSIFPGEIFRPSRRWLEQRFTDLRYYHQPDRGGHFAAFEQPELFVDEVRRCFRAIREG
ncbi:MAG TPA: epoxide hydrolase [Acidimicrobiales bacterium]|nr:epoxide hydrolase [Acidimicrobiales bacterium]